MSDTILEAASKQTVAAASKKPIYLLSVSNKKTRLFISLDTPELLNGFVRVKGFFSEESESDINSNFVEIISNVLSTNKDLIVDIMFPSNKIDFLKSLVYKAK